MKEICIEKSFVWKPSKENRSDSPRLEYVDSLFRRRLSQLSKMTVESVRNVLLKEDGTIQTDVPLIFASMRGEVSRQLKINRSLVEENDVSPAQFSLSVFNAPPAVTTIALGINAPYVAIYPVRFSDALQAVRARLCSGIEKVVFAFADEKIPEEYEKIAQDDECEVLSFAALFSKNSFGILLPESDFESPKSFVHFLEKQRENQN